MIHVGNATLIHGSGAVLAVQGGAHRCTLHLAGGGELDLKMGTVEVLDLLTRAATPREDRIIEAMSDIVACAREDRIDDGNIERALDRAWSYLRSRIAWSHGVLLPEQRPEALGYELKMWVHGLDDLERVSVDLVDGIERLLGKSDDRLGDGLAGDRLVDGLAVGDRIERAAAAHLVGDPGDDDTSDGDDSAGDDDDDDTSDSAGDDDDAGDDLEDA